MHRLITLYVRTPVSDYYFVHKVEIRACSPLCYARLKAVVISSFVRTIRIAVPFEFEILITESVPSAIGNACSAYN